MKLLIQINKVLYITNDDLYIKCINENLVIINNKTEEKITIPLIILEEIVIFGNTTISNYLIKNCTENNIVISYVSTYGNFYGRFYGKNTGNVFLRQKQYLLNEEKRLNFCKNSILAKSLNYKNLVLRMNRDCDDIDKKNKLVDCANKIGNNCAKIKDCDNIDSLRGLEGDISNIYFGNFDNMIKTKDEDMFFHKRSKKPPKNNCNAVLSLLYTLLTMNVTAGLETFGLDSQYGYMHSLRSGRASLSCDIVEEFRGLFVDKFVLTLINRNQINSSDFEFGEDGIRLNKNSMKKVLDLWEKFKEEEILFPLYNTKVKRKIIPYLQAQLLAQYIRGDIEQYPPFRWK